MSGVVVGGASAAVAVGTVADSGTFEGIDLSGRRIAQNGDGSGSCGGG